MLGKTAIITGAAGGIGIAVARRMAAKGANVALVDLDPKMLETLAVDLRLDDAKTLTVAADVSRQKDWGWEPPTTLLAGLTATYKHYLEEHGL